MKYSSQSESVSLPMQSITGHVHVDRVVVMVVRAHYSGSNGGEGSAVLLQQCGEMVRVCRAA